MARSCHDLALLILMGILLTLVIAIDKTETDLDATSKPIPRLMHEKATFCTSGAEQYRYIVKCIPDSNSLDNSCVLNNTEIVTEDDIDDSIVLSLMKDCRDACKTDNSKKPERSCSISLYLNQDTLSREEIAAYTTKKMEDLTSEHTTKLYGHFMSCNSGINHYIVMCNITSSNILIDSCVFQYSQVITDNINDRIVSLFKEECFADCTLYNDISPPSCIILYFKNLTQPTALPQASSPSNDILHTDRDPQFSTTSPISNQTVTTQSASTPTGIQQRSTMSSTTDSTHHSTDSQISTTSPTSNGITTTQSASTTAGIQQDSTMSNSTTVTTYLSTDPQFSTTSPISNQTVTTQSASTTAGIQQDSMMSSKTVTTYRSTDPQFSTTLPISNQTVTTQSASTTAGIQQDFMMSSKTVTTYRPTDPQFSTTLPISNQTVTTQSASTTAGIQQDSMISSKTVTTYRPTDPQFSTTLPISNQTVTTQSASTPTGIQQRSTMSSTTDSTHHSTDSQISTTSPTSNGISKKSAFIKTGIPKGSSNLHHHHLELSLLIVITCIFIVAFIVMLCLFFYSRKSMRPQTEQIINRIDHILSNNWHFQSPFEPSEFSLNMQNTLHHDSYLDFNTAMQYLDMQVNEVNVINHSNTNSRSTTHTYEEIDNFTRLEPATETGF
ncbi:uncharacterized protein LOC117108913 [Anneissia japonica]|uniref:uncharacterized protein LOC117108913 n=1 Tax=Anneissia japonica TaxID=1529436 RepID=UPI001425524E|nr:uncharacterized protein LOC117108913 [Anneissia japonica]